MRFEQSIIHEQYLNHLFEKFNYLCTSSASVKRATRKLYPDTSSVYFTTRQLVAATELHTLFYSEGRKIVPWNISSLLTEKSLAYCSTTIYIYLPSMLLPPDEIKAGEN